MVPWVRQGEGLRPIGQWTTVLAPQQRILMMTRSNDLSHWEGHQKNVDTIAKPSDPELGRIWETAQRAIKARSAITLETSVKVLYPLSKRHLQMIVFLPMHRGHGGGARSI